MSYQVNYPVTIPRNDLGLEEDYARSWSNTYHPNYALCNPEYIPLDGPQPMVSGEISTSHETSRD